MAAGPAPLPSDGSAARLLFVARWHAALSQTEVADRAGTAQQTYGRYESGRSQPTLPVLERLLAACGMNLSTTLTPCSLPEDPSTRDLIAAPPLDRLPPPYPQAVERLFPAMAAHGVDAIVGDKVAARFYGAPVRVPFCEFWIDGATVRFEELEAMLTSIGGRDFWRFEQPREDDDRGPEGVQRLWAELDGTDIRFRAVKDFALLRERAWRLEVTGLAVRVVDPAELAAGWHARHRDHLLLQRALHLRRQQHPPLLR